MSINPKVVPLKAWGTQACLAHAAELIPNSEKMIVLTYDEEGTAFYLSANLDHAQALWLLESIKARILQGKNG